jgi:hypothetical protein
MGLPLPFQHVNLVVENLPYEEFNIQRNFAFSYYSYNSTCNPSICQNMNKYLAINYLLFSVQKMEIKIACIRHKYNTTTEPLKNNL